MKLTATLILILSCFSLFGQTPEMIATQADKYFSNEQYFTAINYYKQALTTDEDFTKAKYQLAECYRLTFDYETAEFYYGEVAQLGSEVYPLAGFYYGLMKKLNGKFDEAIIELNKAVRFLKQNGFSEDDRYRKFYKQARVEEAGCQFALNELSKPKLNRNFHLLGEPVNTEFNDYGAFTYQHDSSLVISSGRSGGTGNLIDNKFGESFADIFRFSEVEEDVWKEAKDRDKFSKNINTKLGDGAGAFNRERTKYYFTNCNTEDQGGCSIFLSELKDGEWTEPTALNSNVNKRSTNSKHPTLSLEGDTIFFTSDRNDGVGGFDVWFSVSYAGENWGVAQNMGEQVNTSFNEISPFYDAKDRALFFASDGHRGFGGLDIFMARGKNFLNPEIFNIGAPYNSNQDECFFMIGEKHGYISSNRDGGIGRFDIYSFRIETEEEIISEIQVEEAIAGRNSIFSDDYEFDNSNETRINDIISKRLAAQVANVDAVLTAEEQSFFDNLSKDDKERIERIVDARYRNMAQSDLRALRIEDEFYYQELGREERRAVDQMILSRIEQNDLALTIKYDEPTIEFYNALSKEEKEKIDQFVAFKLKEAEKILLSPDTYNSLDAKSKREVDNITLKYFEEKKNLEQLSLNPTSLMFIRNLEGVTKQNIYEAVKEQIINLANGDNFTLTEDDRIFYQNLSTADIDKLEGIATAFIAADLNQFQDYITPTERSFYQTLNSIQKKSADRVLAKMISNIIKSDLYYAEVTLNKQQMQILADKKASLSSLSEIMASLNEPAMSDLNSLSDKSKRRLMRFAGSALDEFLASEIEGYFPEGVEKIAEEYAILANKKEAEQEDSELSEPMAMAEPSTSTETDEPAKATDPLEMNTSDSVLVADSPESGQGDVPNVVEAQNDQQVASTDTDSIDPIKVDAAADEKEAIQLAPTLAVKELEKEDALFYDDNEPIVKLAIDRYIAAEYLNSLGSAPKVKEQAEQEYKSLTSVEKEYARLLIAKEEGDEIEPMLLVPAQNFYNSSAPKVKEKWNQIVFAEVLPIAGNRFTIAAEDRQVINQLNEDEKEKLAKIQQHRLSNKRLIPDVQLIEANDIPERKVLENLVSYNLDTYDYVYISGKLTDEKSGEPLVNFPVALRKKDGEVKYETYTDNSGQFQFENIPAENYEIISPEPGNKTFGGSYFVRDLEVSGATKNVYDNTVSTSLYFESGSVGLRSEGELTLDEIAEAYQKAKNKFIIELDGHTDNLGDEENNRSLSKQRSQIVYQYLTSKGVPANNIVINFYGQNKPASTNKNPFGRQFNRRVEITVKSDEKIEYYPADIYLVRPKGTLYSIAKNFNVEIEDLKKWNGFSENDILQAYKPLRIFNPKNIKPNLDMLVELNPAVLEQGYRDYIVKEGETLQDISSKFNVPAELILETNSLSENSTVKAGQKIKIYISY